MKTIVFFLLLIVALWLPATGQDMGSQGQGGVSMDRAGQTSMNFLQVGLSPKIAGRGNIYSTLGKGTESIFGNPAGLTEGSTPYEAFFSTTQWFADIKYIGGAVAWNAGNYGVFGFHYINVDYGKIKGTFLPDANVGDDNYILTGNVENVGAYSFGLSYAKQINPKFAMGGTIKYVAQQLGRITNPGGSTSDNNQGKWAVDLGLRYYPGWNSVRFAMTMRNFSTFVRYQNQSFSLPLIYSLGVGLNVMELIDKNLVEHHSVVLCVEFVHPNNHTERINTGVEYTFMNMFTLRGGYESNHEVLSWSMGAGVAQHIGDIQCEIDYSYSLTQYFGGVNRFSLLVGF